MAERPDQRMLREVTARQGRMIRARGRKNCLWSSVAVFGSVGWSIAIPAVLGVALGVWIDNRWHSRFSWSVMLLVAGLLAGCINAWRHISGGQK